jgi:signal transduction histidine kinase
VLPRLSSLAPGGPLFQRLPVRRKLLAMALLPLLVALPLLGLLLLWWGNEALDRLLITKVRSDLAVANGYFERVRGEVGAGAAAVADSFALQQMLAGPRTAWPDALERFRVREGLDFLHLHAADGGWLAGSHGERPAEGGLAPHAPGAPRTSLEVLSGPQLQALGAALRQRVAVTLLATRNAAPSARTLEDRAMVLLSTRPVLAADGRVVGHIQGGTLLNRNLDFIDHINGIVYPEGSLPFGSRGTATLFLDDVRISTNVRLFEGRAAAAAPSAARQSAEAGRGDVGRAIGTRVSQTVRDAVLGRGSTWLDRAFVVNDWYVSGYQPLADGQGRAIGMLYVGFTERPFTLLKYAALLSIGAVFLAVMAGAAVVSLRWARTIFRPLEAMEATLQRVEAGDGAARVGTRAAAAAPEALDEIGRLARHLDQLLEVIDDKTRSLQRWNAELDAKVAERTAQLAQAQDLLVKNEKLAAVGQLTASIAHEINNPIAVIQGNLDLMRELLGREQVERVKPELNLLDEQVERMRLIVTQLLQFARPTEFAGYVDAVPPSRVVEDCLVLVGHLLARTRIEVQRSLQASRSAAINRQELQQVLVNLLVNAIHAMPDGGTLHLATRDWGGAGAAGGVEIEVADSGPGLAPELLAQLFQPFVTRKRDGTGLGLWISRSLVERYGGDISAANRQAPATGAVFTVRLREETDGAA